MLHGLGSSGASWRHVAPALGERFRVIAPDARGHGDSDWTHGYSPADGGGRRRISGAGRGAGRHPGRPLDGRGDRIRGCGDPARSSACWCWRRCRRQTRPTRPGRTRGTLNPMTTTTGVQWGRPPPLAQPPAERLVGDGRPDRQQDPGDQRAAQRPAGCPDGACSPKGSRGGASSRLMPGTPSTRSGRASSCVRSSRSSPGSPSSARNNLRRSASRGSRSTPPSSSALAEEEHLGSLLLSTAARDPVSTYPWSHVRSDLGSDCRALGRNPAGIEP